jgi:cyclopropane fatty-acyl-phospholipid synthase-like methyltransferase
MALASATELSRYLKNVHHDAKGVDKLKIGYRPYICPFDDLLALAKPDERIFDVGCGSGQFALLLAKYVNPSWIGGAEISGKLVKNARELFANSGMGVAHEFNVFDGKTFPKSVGSADKVFLIDVFHHVPVPEQTSFLRNLRAAMRPGAVLVLKDIDAGSVLVYFNKLHDLVLSREIGHEVRASQLLGLAREAGFELVSESFRRMLWYPHFTLVLKRD